MSEERELLELSLQLEKSITKQMGQILGDIATHIEDLRTLCGRLIIARSESAHCLKCGNETYLMSDVDVKAAKQALADSYKIQTTLESLAKEIIS